MSTWPNHSTNIAAGSLHTPTKYVMGDIYIREREKEKEREREREREKHLEAIVNIDAHCTRNLSMLRG